MNADTLQIISIIAFVLGGILLAVAVLLFFVLDVRGLWDDLSGKTAERQILKLREQNRHQDSGNDDRFLFEARTAKTDVTAKLPKEQEKVTTMLQDEESTTLLSQGEENTTLLSQDGEGTTLLTQAEEGTTVLAQSDKETTLSEENSLILNEIIIHTKDRI